MSTYTVSRKAPSAQRSSAFLAGGLAVNSTMPFPVGRPRSSTMTMARSTWPNMEKASSSSSLEMFCGRLRTDRAEPCVAKRTRSCRPLKGASSSSARAISARVRVSCGPGGKGAVRGGIGGHRVPLSMPYSF